MGPGLLIWNQSRLRFGCVIAKNDNLISVSAGKHCIPSIYHCLLLLLRRRNELTGQKLMRRCLDKMFRHHVSRSSVAPDEATLHSSQIRIQQVCLFISHPVTRATLHCRLFIISTGFNNKISFLVENFIRFHLSFIWVIYPFPVYRLKLVALPIVLVDKSKR